MILTNIAKYFDRKKVKEGEEGNLNTSRASDILDEVFTESLKSPDYVNILFSCIKNVEKEIKQIFELTKEMKKWQIKGEKQLAELTEAIDFISNKFDEYEKDRKEKEERIKTLEDCLVNMSKRVDSLSGQFDKQEQYSRRNCLLLHGIPENKNEKTDDLCLATINELLELSITEADIERTHPTGKPRDAGQKSRPIIAKFVRYDRKNVFNRKKEIKRKEYCNYGEFNSHSNEKIERGQRNLRF